MNIYIKLAIWVVVVLVVFGLAWYRGYVLRLRNYVAETQEELRKCTWPTRSELQGSTALVAISIVLLSGFTLVVDVVSRFVLQILTQIAS